MIDLTFHNITEITVESHDRDGHAWADVKVKWADFCGKGEQTITFFFRKDAGHIASQLAAALPQMEEA